MDERGAGVTSGRRVEAFSDGLAFVNAIATLAVHAVIASYYCFDQLRTD
jgi:hypothetical protein